MKFKYAFMSLAWTYLLLGTDAHADKTVLHSQCPTNNPDAPADAWKVYLSGTFPAEPNPARPYPGQTGPNIRISATVGVQFRFAKSVNDPGALPGIDPAACYSIVYRKSAVPGFAKGYQSYRSWDIERRRRWRNPNEHQYYLQNLQGLPGDPEKYEINVGGTLLKYKESGEVLNLKGAVVGMLVCYWSDECERYRY